MGLWIGIIRKTACYEVNRMEARRLEAKLGPKCKKPLISKRASTQGVYQEKVKWQLKGTPAQQERRQQD
jgi:hypothetical protein